MKYESNILERLIKTYGVVGNPKYVSEIIKQFIIQGKECYPNLFTYQSDLLAHIDEFGLANDYVVTYTGQRFYAPNTKESPVKRAILSGSTKYRDIDTGDILDTFDETKNLELVSVKMPVLTTSNEDGTKSNILTVNEDVVLRGVGDVKDELNCLTGEVTQYFDEVTFGGSDDENFVYLQGYSNNDIALFEYQNYFDFNISTLKRDGNMMCDKFSINPQYLNPTKEGVYCQYKHINVMIENSKLSELSPSGFRTYLKQNPIKMILPKQKSIKTVDLNIKDQNNQVVNHLTSFEGGTHFDTSSRIGSVLPTLEVDVVVDLEETLKTCSLEGNTM